MKLTLVSISFKGKLLSGFFNLPHENGKAVISQSIINQMTEKAGCHNGQTFSIG